LSSEELREEYSRVEGILEDFPTTLEQDEEVLSASKHPDGMAGEQALKTGPDTMI
jgi:hypothetical protein